VDLLLGEEDVDQVALDVRGVHGGQPTASLPGRFTRCTG
jgi:hypothetical protein